jgi:flagellar L-ring protein precursor FlgH
MKIRFKFGSKPCARLVGMLGALTALIGGLSPDLRAGSLWRESVTDERGMFADKRARRVGDILTLVVSEGINSTNTLTLSVNRNNAGTKPGLMSNLVNQFIGGVASSSGQRFKITPSSDPGIQKNLSTDAGAEGTRGFPGNLLPRVQSQVPSYFDPLNSKTTNENTDVQKQTLTLRSQIGVQVIDVLPNGNLVIEGIRQMVFSGQRYTMSMRGIVRSMDVTAMNTVSSSMVADARFDVIPEGENATAIRKGWLQKLDEKITPW